MDILIKNGLVIDGTGTPARNADVSVRRGKITNIGTGLTGRADQVINADGLVVAPGFIDITNHADTYLTLLHNPKSESLLAQGITTAVIGNCGASLAPMTHGRLIAVVQKWGDVRGLNIDWQTYGEFLDVIDRLRPGVNVLGFVGHTTLRRDVLADEFRDPREDELDQMVMLFEQAMEQGAFGLSIGLSYAHARVAPDWELDGLVQALKRTGGLLSVHLRDEREKLLDATNEAIAIAKRGGVPLEIVHMKSVGDEAGSEFPMAVKAIDAAVAEGLDVNMSVFPFETQHAVLYLLFPQWAQEGGFTELRKRLKDATIRKKVVEEMQDMHIPWSDYVVAEASLGKSAVGKSLKELAEHMTLSPAEAVVNLFLAHEGRVLLFHRCKGPSHLKEALAHPRTHVVSAGGGYALSDVESGSLVHPRSFGAMPEFLGHWIREKDTLSLEEGIQRITYGPATKLGLKERGALRVGDTADITIFDAASIANRATLKAPYQYPEGIRWVIVGGKVGVNPDGVTGSRLGMTIRRRT